MRTDDIDVAEFVRLLDVAIALSEKIKIDADSSSVASWEVKSAELTIKNLKGFRDAAISGRLPRSSRGEVPPGTGLGLSRGVGEWSEDEKLLDAVCKVEDFYKKHL